MAATVHDDSLFFDQDGMGMCCLETWMAASLGSGAFRIPSIQRCQRGRGWLLLVQSGVVSLWLPRSSSAGRIAALIGR